MKLQTVAVWKLTGRELADVVAHTDEHACALQVISSLYMDLHKNIIDGQENYIHVILKWRCSII